MPDTQTVFCNLCGAIESLPIYTLRDIYGMPGEFVLRRCLCCGLMYLSPRPAPEIITSYYPAEYDNFRPPIEDERWIFMRWARRRKLIKRRHLIEYYSRQSCGRLLDVGCATGLFLHEMDQAGWQAVGVEPITSAADYARSRFGLDVFQGTLAEAPYELASFDVVTFWDVLEHTFSPADELARVANLLRPGGLLVISIPNWNSPDRWLFGPYWQGLDAPRHMYVFTRKTLTAFLTQAGFLAPDWICFMPGYFSFAMSVERWLKRINPSFARFVRWILDSPGMRFPFEPWFMLNNWLGKGPIISAFACKRPVEVK